MAPKTGPKSEGLNLESFAAAGLQFALGIVFFLFIGRWADRKFDSTPLFTLLGVFVGGGAAFYSFYRRISAAQRADDERRRKEKAAGSQQ